MATLFTFDSLNDDAPSGTYKVNDDSYVILKRQSDNKQNFDYTTISELFEFMYRLPPIPNPMRPSTFLKRSQATFSPINYDFGQKTKTFPYDEKVPKVVQTCKTIVENTLREYNFNEKYNGTHISMYPDGNAGVDPHEDDEDVIDQSVPIASISFGETRKFAFYRNQTSEERNKQIEKSKAKVKPAPKPVKIVSTNLHHGDILLMVNMQKIGILHGIVKDSKITKPRLNLTYRRFVASVDDTDAVSEL
jgi:alkylated DNA repair dioxygenase AlkB